MIAPIQTFCCAVPRRFFIIILWKVLKKHFHAYKIFTCLSFCLLPFPQPMWIVIITNISFNGFLATTTTLYRAFLSALTTLPSQHIKIVKSKISQSIEAAAIELFHIMKRKSGVGTKRQKKLASNNNRNFVDKLVGKRRRVEWDFTEKSHYK